MDPARFPCERFRVEKGVRRARIGVAGLANAARVNDQSPARHRQRFAVWGDKSLYTAGANVLKNNGDVRVPYETKRRVEVRQID